MVRRLQRKPRNRRVKRGPVGPHEAILTLHMPGGRAELAETLVFVDAPGGDDRLLSQHAFAFHRRVQPDGIVNPPAPGDQPRGQRADVLDAYGVDEHVAAAGGPRFIGDVPRPHRHPNAFGQAVVETAGLRGALHRLKGSVRPRSPAG